MTHYVAVMLAEKEGGYSVLFPDLPGCATVGDTLDEGVAMATDALAGHIASLREFGDPIPAPRSLDRDKSATD